LTRPYQEVGIYGAAYKILEVLITLPILFMGLILPQLANSFADNDKERFNRVLQKSWDGLCLFTLPMVAGTIILAKPIIKLIAGDSYANAANVLQILIVATGIIFLGSLFTHAIVAVNQQKNMILYYFLAALLALGLYLYFIPIYSYYAAALITVICELLIAIAAFIKVRQKTYFKISLMIFIKAAVASLIMALALKILIALPLIILVAAGAIIYGLILWITKTLPHSLIS
ncbi:MAG: polysaccharide biosynthesis C-terminal domain-containing protein, partial [Candidatus Komeilibacteria bacterium]|nr:polysaccharide biosynthesis C-terminal domain-containing protein [Candidatus Komeilibacteria bacterium]